MALTEIPIELSSTPSIVDGGNATAITIDSSENVLVGKTALEYENTAGHIFRNDGLQSSIRSGGNVADFNRLSSDGEIIRLSKDGTTVGSIGTGSGLLTIGKGTGNLVFENALVAPCSDSSAGSSNGVVDLGASSRRFKDLHLSGKAYMTGLEPGQVTITSGSYFIGNASAGYRFNNAADNTNLMILKDNGTMLVNSTSATTTTKFQSTGAGGTFAGVFVNAYGSAGYGVAISSASGEAMYFYHGGGIASPVGRIATTSSATSYITSSDYRLKENVVAMTSATERLKQLNPLRFNFIVDADTTVDGFLAHEVQDVVPEAITGTKDAMRDEEYEVTPAVLDDDGNVTTEAVMGTRSVPDYQGIDQSKLVPLLVATIQELEARLTALENN
jgi:hypothetical protein